jgi:hypothetical protein
LASNVTSPEVREKLDSPITKFVFKESLEGQKLSPQGLKEWLARQPARTRAKPKDKE